MIPKTGQREACFPRVFAVLYENKNNFPAFCTKKGAKEPFMCTLRAKIIAYLPTVYKKNIFGFV